MADKKKMPWEEDDIAPPAGAPSIPLPPVENIGKKAPWEEEALEAKRQTGTYPPHGGTPQPMTSSSFLPVAYDRSNQPFFDINAGLTGDVGRLYRRLEKTIVGGENPNTPEGVRDIHGGMRVITGPAGASRGLGVSARAMPRAGQPGALTALPGPTGPPGFGARNMTGLTAVPTSAPNLFYGGNRQGAAVPTTAELLDRAKNAPGTGYNELRKLGIEYSPQAIKDWALGMKQQLMQHAPENLTSGTHGQLDAIIKSADDALLAVQNNPTATAGAPYEVLDATRRFFARNRMRTHEGKVTDDAHASQQALKGMEGFLGRNAPGDLAPGSASARGVKDALDTNAGNFAAASRAGALESLDRYATLSAGATGSGQNFDNRARQALRTHLTAGHGKRVRGWNDAEIGQAEGVVAGGPAANLTRFVGNIMGGGGGLGMGLGGAAGATVGSMVGGGWLGGVLGAGVPPTIGFGLKGIENRIAQGNMDKLGETLRQRSPMFQERAAASARNPSFADPVAEAFNVRAVRDKARALAPTNAVGQSFPAGAQPTQDPAWLTEEIKRRIAAGQVI